MLVEPILTLVYMKKAKTNFLKYLQQKYSVENTNITPVLDGLCKMSVLKIPIDSLCFPSSVNCNIHFRILCFQLRYDIFFGESQMFDNAITNYIQVQPMFKSANRKRIREPLIIAYHLKKKHEYYKALLIYQLIDRMQNELKHSNIRIIA